MKWPSIKLDPDDWIKSPEEPRVVTYLPANPWRFEERRNNAMKQMRQFHNNNKNKLAVFLHVHAYNTTRKEAAIKYGVNPRRASSFYQEGLHQVMMLLHEWEKNQ